MPYIALFIVNFKPNLYAFTYKMKLNYLLYAFTYMTVFIKKLLLKHIFKMSLTQFIIEKRKISKSKSIRFPAKE